MKWAVSFGGCKINTSEGFENGFCDDSPSDHLLNVCTKDQLLKIAECYNIDKRLKESITAIWKANLSVVFKRVEGM